MRIGLALAIAGLWAGTAIASDKPVVAPPQDWVKAATPPALNARVEGAPVQVMLQDQQVSFGRDGKTVYSESVLRIEAPQGLAAGTISFAWNPETDTPVVHSWL